MRRIPRAGGDEVGQGLVVAVLTQLGGHRLHRFALPAQQQSPQIHPAPPTLIRSRERLEHIRREVLETAPDLIQLPRSHTPVNDTAPQPDTPPASEPDQAL